MSTTSLRTLRFIEPLETRIAPAAILNVTDVSAKLPAVAVPGDSGSVTFTITNNGDMDFTSDSGIIIELSSDANPLGASIEVGHFENSTPAIKAGDSKTITKAFKIPPLQIPNPVLPAGSVFVIVDVRASADYGVSEGHGYVFQFGQVGDRKVSLPAIDGDGTKVTFKMSGAGLGELQPAGGAVDLAFAGVDKTSIAGATAAGGDGAVLLNDIGSATAIKGLVMPGVSANGNLVFTEGLLGLQLKHIGSAAAHTVLNVGAGDNAPAKMRFEKVTEMDFNIARGLTSLTIGEWDNTSAGADTLTALFIDKLTVDGKKLGLTGNFEANLNLTGENAAGVALGKATLSGGINDSQWSVATGSVKEIVADSANQWLLDVPNGFVNDIFIKKNLIGNKTTPALEAQTFGEIKVTGQLDASIKATLANAKNAAIDKLSASQVTGITVEAPAGGINKVDVGEWTGGGRIDTRWIKMLEADGLFVPTDGNFSAALNLTGPIAGVPGVERTLGKAMIRGDITGGTWTLEKGAGSIAAGNTSSTWSLRGGTTQDIDISSLTVKGDLDGEVSGGFFGKIIVGGTLEANITAINASYGVGTLTAGKISTATIKAENGGIGSLTAGEWQGGSLRTLSLDRLVITGNARAGVQGDLVGVNVEILSDVTLDLFSVRGSMTNVNLKTLSAGYTGVLHAGEWIGGSFEGGYVSKIDIGGGVASGNLQNVNINVTGIFSPEKTFSINQLLVGNSVVGSQITTVGHIGNVDVGAMLDSDITATGRDINRIEISGIKGAAGPFYDNSTVTAKNLFKVIVRDINEAGAAEYGFDADFISSYTRYKGTANVFPIRANIFGPEVFDAVPAGGTGYRVNVT